MKFILAKKIAMQQTHKNGAVVPVTVVEAGPCLVTQVKTAATDGYDAVQLAFGKKHRMAKPQRGHVKEKGPFRWLREFRVSADGDGLKVGDTVSVDRFAIGDLVTVVGTTKGRGMAGVVRRHGFHGGPKTHGHKDDLRMPGSIGAGGVQRVFKGMRMGGRMGSERVTIKNLEVMGVDAAKNQLTVNGAVPGARNGLLLIRTNE